MSDRSVRVVRPEDDARTIYGAGDTYRYLATGKETDQHYFILEGTVPPGAGPPPHIQTREEEAFYILEGTVTFYSDDGEIQASQGTYINIPKGAKHKFRNNSDTTAKMLIFFAPAGIENLFDAMAADKEIAANPEEVIQKMNQVASGYGLSFFGEDGG